MTNNALLGPISNALSEQFGLDPKLAQMVVIFALTTVVPAILRRLQGGGGQGSRIPSPIAPGGAGSAELDLDDLLARIGSQGSVGRDYLRSTGLSQQLATQTGLDQEIAEDSLQQTLFMLGRFVDMTMSRPKASRAI